MKKQNTYHIERDFLNKLNTEELLAKIIFLRLKENYEKRL